MGRRWPRWVYEGDEPDYRFSFANERTFLAWIRTSLTLVAAGVAIDVVDLPVSAERQRWTAILLIVVGLSTAAWAWVRWARSERAIRSGRPLPALGIGAAALVIAVAVAVVVLATDL